jgi:hypothetical protein
LSEIRANTISDAAGTGPIDLHKQSAAKAWINFSGTTATIRDSFNTSSLTDNGVGDYTVNFTNAMGNANYAAAHAGGQRTVAWGFYLGTSTYGSTTTGHRFHNTRPDDVLDDTSYISLTFVGDLA